MSFGDVVRIELKGHVLSQAHVNIFHYQDIGAASTSSVSDVRTEFASSVMPSLEAMCNFNMVFEQLNVYQEVGGSSFIEAPFTSPIPGLRSGDCLPPAQTFGFRYVRTIIGLRHGAKRVSGVSESDQQDGDVFGATALANVAATAAAFEAHLTDANGGDWQPVIVSRFFEGQPRSVPIDMPIATVVGLSLIGSQNSRKAGRGA